MGPLLGSSLTAADAAVAVDQVRLPPEFALPLRGLLQQMMPGNRVVARRIEAAIVNRAPHRLVHVADQTAVKGEASEDRQIALSDTEGQIAARCIAPFGDDPAVAQHEAVRAAARPDRAERLVPGRLFPEIRGDGMGQIAAPRGFVLGSMSRCDSERSGVKTGAFGGGSLPPGWIGRRDIGHEAVSEMVQG